MTKFFRFSIAGVLLVALALVPVRRSDAASGGNAMAVVGKVLGGALIIVGVVSLVADISSESYPKIPLDVLEIAGGAVAMMNNSQTDDQTKDNSPKGPSSKKTGSVATGGGLNLPNSLNNPDINVADQCKQAGQYCTCTGTTTCQPQLSLPPVDDLKTRVEAAYKADPGSFNGTGLDQALADLDKNYAKAQDAVSKFNSASAGGAYDNLNGNGSDSLVADGAGKKSAGSGDGHNEAATYVDGTEGGDGKGGPNLSNLLAYSIENRGPQKNARTRGLDLEDEKSHVLTIFERVTRALRGTNDRDLVLERIELVRRGVRKKKGPTNAISKS